MVRDSPPEFCPQTDISSYYDQILLYAFSVVYVVLFMHKGRQLRRQPLHALKKKVSRSQLGRARDFCSLMRMNRLRFDTTAWNRYILIVSSEHQNASQLDAIVWPNRSCSSIWGRLASNYTLKLSPHPQFPVELGFSKRNSAESSSST